MITKGNIDDRNPVLDLALFKNIFGKLFGDKGYLSQDLFIDLYNKTRVLDKQLAINILSDFNFKKYL